MKIDKSMFKMKPEELQHWLYLRKKGYVIQNKKGKGSYKRKKGIDKYDESKN